MNDIEDLNNIYFAILELDSINKKFNDNLKYDTDYRRIQITAERARRSFDKIKAKIRKN